MTKRSLEIKLAVKVTFKTIIMSDFPPNLSIRPLTIEDIDKCIQLEAKGFQASERCSEEKFRYRLTVCPELCSGLFIRDYDIKYNAINLPEVADRLSKQQDDQDVDLDEIDPLPVKSSVINETLIGHIIATRTKSHVIDEMSMEIASDDNPNAGHFENSRFIGVHSLVVDPVWQGKNLGTLLLHDYIQKLSNQDLGDKVIIIAHHHLIPFYEKIGFTNLGKSDCKFAGETWYDLSIDLVAEDDL